MIENLFEEEKFWQVWQIDDAEIYGKLFTDIIYHKRVRIGFGWSEHGKRES